jgi:hypothetical protein
MEGFETAIAMHMSVRVGNDQLGVKFVSFVHGELWWTDSEDSIRLMDPLSVVESAHSVTGNSGRILILLAGQVLVVLHPGDEAFLMWFEAVSAWVPNSIATRKLLRCLAAKAKNVGSTSARVIAAGKAKVAQESAVVVSGGASSSGKPKRDAVLKEIDSWFPRMTESEHKAELLTLELTEIKAELVNMTSLFHEADADRKDLQKKVENVNSAVRLKAIGLLLNSNPDLANLKLQIDCYQEQVQYFAKEMEKLTSRYEAALAKKGFDEKKKRFFWRKDF